MHGPYPYRDMDIALLILLALVVGLPILVLIARGIQANCPPEGLPD